METVDKKQKKSRNYKNQIPFPFNMDESREGFPEFEHSEEVQSTESENEEENEFCNYRLEALKILRDINKPKPEKERSYAALTCELLAKDMEMLPQEEQRVLRRELFELVDAALLRHRNRCAGQ